MFLYFNFSCPFSLWLLFYLLPVFCLIGCWIIYQVAGNQMVELVAYELMSANDAPERDPKDWYDILAKYSCDEILSILQATYVFPAFETDIAISVQEGWYCLSATGIFYQFILCKVPDHLRRMRSKSNSPK